MAEASSRADCIGRHEAYHFDIAFRLSRFQKDRIIAMTAGIQPGDHVLDVGCNSGYIVDFLPRPIVADGVDVARELVALAQKRLNRATVAPAEELPYSDRSVDVVILGEILEHVHDPQEVLREARRVARRAIVGSTPHEAGEWGPRGKRAPARHRFHVRCYTEAELRAELEAAGLVNVQTIEIKEKGTPQIYVFRSEVPALP